MAVLGRLSIQSKVILLLLGVSLASIGTVAWIGYDSGRKSLDQSLHERMTAIRSAKSLNVSMMLDALRDQVIAMSDSQTVTAAARDFTAAYGQLAEATLTPAESESLTSFYATDYLPKLNEGRGGQPVLEQYLPASAAARYLQYHYLAANPAPYEGKQALNAAPGDTSEYGRIHARLHKEFARTVGIFGLEDLLIVDPDSLDIVYSYAKTAEFATNLEVGPYATTQLATLVRSLQGHKERDDFVISDFEKFAPSLGQPMAFIGSPIYDGSELLGILVLQFPIEIFNKVLTADYSWSEAGFGQTGECYLVGPDRTLRSRSRFMVEDTEGLLNTLADEGVAREVLERMRALETGMCLLPVDNACVEEALRGRSGVMKTRGYRGKPVVAAYGPVELKSLRWAVVTSVDESEAHEPTARFGRTVFGLASGLSLASTLLALAFSNLLTRPLRALMAAAERLGAGDTDVSVPIHSEDEFGQLGRVFNGMAASIRKQTEKLETQVRENDELLHSILPASAVESRRDGDERAQREFADVSVLVAEIVGMEGLGTPAGESRALAVLTDLVAAIDEAAEAGGIEKVRTIGTTYLAVCGLSVTRPDHVRRMLAFAREIERIVGIFNRDHHLELGVSIGVSAGPVVGGVVGRRRFLYDLWGETVAVAKGLACQGGTAIRVTDRVRERTGELFDFVGPSSVAIDGRPAIETWSVKG
jgi:class 3 adenylate cyclase